jgi:hypothetical protein
VNVFGVLILQAKDKADLFLLPLKRDRYNQERKKMPKLISKNGQKGGKFKLFGNVHLCIF